MAVQHRPVSSRPQSIVSLGSSKLCSKVLATDPRQETIRAAASVGGRKPSDRNRLEPNRNSPAAGPNFVQLFEAQVERTPNAVAVLGGDSEFTYRELNDRANQFARYFQSLGVGMTHWRGCVFPAHPR